jgi:tRNA nucleotidyltransferase (CCA-adding enzyme)
MDNATIDAVCGLVRYHDKNPLPNDKAVRRAIFSAGKQQYPQIFEIKKADILAQSDYQKQEKLDYLVEYERLYHEILSREECLSLKELAVDGSDLIAAGIKPGKEIGQILKQLLDMVIDEPEKNTKEYLMRYTLENLFI